MERIYSAEINDCIIVIAAKDGVYIGVVRKSGKECFRESHENLEILKAKLHNEAGQLHPDYIGIDGAIKRFKQFFPLGFSDPFYKIKERDYKDEVVRRLSGLSVFALQNELSSQERVLQHVIATESEVVDKSKHLSVVKKFEDDILALKNSIETLAPPDQWRLSPSDVTINLLSSFENARLYEMLSHGNRTAFFEGVNTLILESLKASPDYSTSLKVIEEAIKPYGRATWPLVTIMPFLWGASEFGNEAAETMFLKPVATKDYADRVGHEFAHRYTADINSDTYESLLDLARWTKKAIGELEPQDKIDVQSFIWIVGNYKDADLIEAEEYRALNPIQYRK